MPSFLIFFILLPTAEFICSLLVFLLKPRKAIFKVHKPGNLISAFLVAIDVESIPAYDTQIALNLYFVLFLHCILLWKRAVTVGEYDGPPLTSRGVGENTRAGKLREREGKLSDTGSNWPLDHRRSPSLPARGYAPHVGAPRART